jgi:hypothetical protein
MMLSRRLDMGRPRQGRCQSSFPSVLDVPIRESPEEQSHHGQYSDGGITYHEHVHGWHCHHRVLPDCFLSVHEGRVRTISGYGPMPIGCALVPLAAGTLFAVSPADFQLAEVRQAPNRLS